MYKPKILLSYLLCNWGGCVYFFLEVIYKTLRGEPERISWTMLLVAIILSIPLERGGAELPWSMPLALQALVCTILITITEFIVGLILNVWLGLGVWDYSHLPGNILGQICPQFMCVWYLLSFIFIPVFDWIKYAILGGEVPRYKLFRW